MKLDRVEIKNFRSIKDQTLFFSRNFMTLVGINESGKSNILRAVSLLSDDLHLVKNDIRDPGHDEDSIRDAFVRFVFDVGERLVNRVYENLTELVLCKSEDTQIIEIGGKTHTLKSFCSSRREFFYNVDLIKETKKFGYWKLSSSCTVPDHWKKIKSDATYKLKSSGIAISEYNIVNERDYPEIPKDQLELLSADELNKLVGNNLVEIAQEHVPIPMLWEYSEENLLPERVDYAQFVADPDVCRPLKYMFDLAGYRNAGKTLSQAELKTNGIRNVLRKVGDNITRHMRQVWPEWKRQKVTLFQNGGVLEAGIEDEYNFYSLSRRSDGFKRFFTFLLMISVQNETQDIRNNVILIDEPDLGLHPSGIQYLRDELKKISFYNRVLITTHSIFMIDKEIIDRHLIVEKRKEITEFKNVSSSNITDEEVIFKALGYSLFELLKPKNIIFEGWRDKKIMETFLRSNKGKGLFDKEELAKTGLLHAMGAKDIARVANTCENFNREYVILSDSDEPAIERKRQFEGKGKWFLLNELEGIDAVTVEDLLINKHLNRSIKTALREAGVDIKIEIPEEVQNKKISKIQSIFSQQNINKKRSKELCDVIKEYACERAKAANLCDCYGDVAKSLMRELHRN